MLSARNDLSLYEHYAFEWWLENSPRFRSLQRITPFRLQLIREMAGPVTGKKTLDLGCGGGLLAVPLIQEGALLTGIDLSPASVLAAQKAARGRGQFFCGDARFTEFEPETFDLVLLADVVDHIPGYAQAIRNAARALKRNGRLFVSTINRTALSYLLAVRLGEGLRLIPPGTHDWQMFVKPGELIAEAEKAGLDFLRTQGEWPRFFSTLRNWAIELRKSKSLALAYSAVFKKP